MADYKILQNIDLAQNEIKEVSKISNDNRIDNKDKGLRIQTGDDTSLTFNRKVGKNSNYIKGIVKEETPSEKTNESIFTVNPSEISILNESGNISDVNYATSKLTLGLDTDKKEHIEAISPLVDIKTGGVDYTDPHISLDKKNSTLGLKSSKIEASSKKDSKSSTLTMEDTIVGVSQGITFKDDTDNPNVSLDLNTEGTISLEASKSISETVDKLSVSLDKTTIEKKAIQTITIKNSEEEAKPSQIEIYGTGVKTSKGLASYVALKDSALEEQSSTVIIKTPNNVTLKLDDTENSATLSSKGTITLTSNKDTTTSKEASTIYGKNSIVSKADSITLQTQGYKDTNTTKFPHIELTSDTTNKILVEGETINISSKGSGDTINLSGSKLNVGSTTTEITSSTINVGTDGNILKINTTTPEVTIPSGTKVGINSTIIGIGATGSSTTTISGSNLEVTTPTTNITGTSTLSGATTLQSSASKENTLVVNKESTSITGLEAKINPTKVNIGTDTTTGIIIGNNASGTTLQSNTTNITSPTLSVTSSNVEFGGDTKTQTVSFSGTTESSVTSNVNTSVVGKTFSVKNGSKEDVLKADTTSVSLAGDSTSITSTSVSIGTTTTTGITIGRNAKDTTTELISETTKITSPNINIGQTGTSTLNIGNDSANVTFKGRSNLSITSDTTTSTVKAKNLNFTENLVGNGIKIYWDANLSSLVFAKE